MNVIDAHQHYWSLKRGDYAWLTPKHGSLYRDFGPEELQGLLTSCGVAATVVVQAAATEAETRYLLELARAHPSIAGVVGWVDFEAHDVQQRIRRLVLEGAGVIKGFRPMIQDISDVNWLDRASLNPAFDTLVVHDLCFDALVTPKHLRLLARRLRQHPKLRAVLDHAGKPDIANRAFNDWAAQIEELARIESLHCKLSGLLTEAGSNQNLSELDDFVAHVFACFGAERVIWGSDWPVVTLRATYQRWLEMAHELVRRHAPGKEQAVFASNAARFYRLSLEHHTRREGTRVSHHRS
jgi:L-fuconolactonase